MNFKRLKDNIGNTLRLRPPAIIQIGETLVPQDISWKLISCENQVLKLEGLDPLRLLEIGSDNIHEFRTPDFLMLKCKITIKDKNVEIEPSPVNMEAVLQVLSGFEHQDRMRMLEQAKVHIASPLPSKRFIQSSAVGTFDITSPILAAFDIAERSIKVGAQSAQVMLIAHLLDDLSGVASSKYQGSPTQVRFCSPSGRQFADVIFRSDCELVSGSSNDGRYQALLTFPRYAEVGVWRIGNFLLVDECGNLGRINADEMESIGFPTTVEVLG